MKVLKFGGTSLANSERIHTVFNIIKQNLSAGENKIIVVVSATAGTTDELVSSTEAAIQKEATAQFILKNLKNRHKAIFEPLIKDLSFMSAIDPLYQELQGLIHGISLVHECSPRVLDYVVSFGERLCAQYLSLYGESLNLPVQYIDARSIIKTEKQHNGAAIHLQESEALIQDKTKQDRIYLVTGFISSSLDEVTTNLGRGGSDFSAAIIGSALNADQVEIWTDVDGFMSADPNLVKDAFVLPQVSYEEAMELSYFGAKVIHPQTLMPAIRKNIPVYIKNTLNPAQPGTLISSNRNHASHPVRGIASVNGISMINVQGSGMVGVPGISSRLFNALAQKSINVIMISQASSEHSICFVIDSRMADEACAALVKEFAYEQSTGKIDVIDKIDALTILAAVGENMRGTPGIAGRLFSALGRNSINVLAIAQGSSERNVSVVIHEQKAKKAVNVIHSSFYLAHRIANLFLFGAGQVGGVLLEQIKDNATHLRNEHNLQLNICGIANSKKMLLNPQAIDLSQWQEELATSTKKSDLQQVLRFIQAEQIHNAIFIDATASKEVALSYPFFLRQGIHIVTPNKRANTMTYDYYRELKSLVRNHGAQYGYETTVGAGMPIISTIGSFLKSGDHIQQITGILSGTLNFLFSNLSARRKFSTILKQAYQRGYTEPDPREDLNGMDVGRKVLILAREIGMKPDIEDIDIQTVLPEKVNTLSLQAFWQKLPDYDSYFEQLRLEAKKRKRVLRFVGVVEPDHCFAKILEIDRNDELAQIKSTDNIVLIKTDRYQQSPMCIKGPGAGLQVTAAGILGDIIGLVHHLT
jgi:bifunctional aspartokinase / homoserine dehydrogenase 1